MSAQGLASANVGGLSWFGIVRLGLVQTALGSMVVLTTSTFNRVMVVELSMLAMVPGLLVGLHYAIQILRPRWGHGSDVGGKRTPWIIGGICVLALGTLLAAVAVALMGSWHTGGLLLSIVAYSLIGVGVGASGTSLLVLLAKIVAPSRRAAAATLVWVMMIAGFIVTTIVAGLLLEPFTMGRLVAVTGGVCATAIVVSIAAVWRLEQTVEAIRDDLPSAGRGKSTSSEDASASQTDFKQALRDVMTDPRARLFTIFVFVSMLAYSMQELILEPFAGHVFAMTPAQSTVLSSFQNQGVLAGMIAIGVLATRFGGGRAAVLRWWTIIGCLASALALFALTFGALTPDRFPLTAAVFALGFANGTFAVAAISSMMALASARGTNQSHAVRREGTRMGVWGAAQAIAFGLGGLTGTVLVDASRELVADISTAYGIVFAVEGIVFVVAAAIAIRLQRADDPTETFSENRSDALLAVGEQSLSELRSGS